MATLVSKRIDPDNGSGTDYTSLSAWEAVRNGDLTSSDTLEEAVCWSSGGTADSTVVLFVGWVTSATQYIRIKGSASDRPGTQWNTSKYRLDITSGSGGVYAMRISSGANHIEVDGIQVGNRINTAQDMYGIWYNNTGGAAGWAKVHNCIVRGYGTYTVTGYHLGIVFYNAETGYSYCWNNIVYDWDHGTSADNEGIDCDDAGLTHYIYCNTVHNSRYGIRVWNGTVHAKNNILNSCTLGFDGTFDSGSRNNITEVDAADGGFGTSQKTGTTTGASANKLIDSGGGLSSIKVGSIVKDSGTSYAYVTAIDSDTQLSISADILTSSEAYTIYWNMYGTVTFADEGNDDFGLGTADTVAKEKGVDLSGDAGLVVTTDIKDNTRTVPWDVGAHEITIIAQLDPGSGKLAFGVQSPTGGETPISWATWSNGSGVKPAIGGDADWGKLWLRVDQHGRSAVYDFTNSSSRNLTLTRDVYGSGSGTVVLQIRGHDSTVFAQDDSSPSWETYTAPVAKTWRYIQVRINEA